MYFIDFYTIFIVYGNGCEHLESLVSLIRNAKVVGSTPIIGTIFSNKIIWLLLRCFAFLNTNVHFCAL
ncbi:hypothetical protein AGE13_24715 [Escherichia coli]|nr:hypothetical protein [Escherichia coli]